MNTIINLGWLAVWLGIGIFGLASHSLVFPYFFFGFSVAVLVAHLFLACTRCYHYGRGCYSFGGQLSKRIFSPRKIGPKEPDDSIQAALWFFLMMLPIPFLLYYQDWLWAGIYIVASFGWYIQHKFTACGKCQNEWCPLNPRKKRGE
jgi:hypothetical protein